MATQQIKDLLSLDVGKPTWAVRPARASPLRSDIAYSRADGRRSFDEASQRYKSSASDVPRIGEGDALRAHTESLPIINDYTTELANWSVTGSVNLNKLYGDNIVDGKAAYEIDEGGSSGQIADGGYTWGSEVVTGHFIIERGSAQRFWVQLKDTTDGDDSVLAYFDWSKYLDGDPLSFSGNPIRARWRVFDTRPTGDTTVEIIFKVGVTTESDGLNIQIRPDLDGSSGTQKVHYAAAIRKPHAAPAQMINGSTPNTLGGDNFPVDISQSWFNDEGGTFVAEAEHDYMYALQNNLAGPIFQTTPGFGMQPQPNNGNYNFRHPDGAISLSVRRDAIRNRHKVAYSYDAINGKVRGAFNGQTVGSEIAYSSFSGSVDTSNKLYIFGNFFESDRQQPSRLYSLQYFPKFLSESALSALTT